MERKYAIGIRFAITNQFGRKVWDNISATSTKKLSKGSQVYVREKSSGQISGYEGEVFDATPTIRSDETFKYEIVEEI